MKYQANLSDLLLRMGLCFLVLTGISFIISWTPIKKLAILGDPEGFTMIGLIFLAMGSYCIGAAWQKRTTDEHR